VFKKSLRPRQTYYQMTKVSKWTTEFPEQVERYEIVKVFHIGNYVSKDYVFVFLFQKKLRTYFWLWGQKPGFHNYNTNGCTSTQTSNALRHQQYPYMRLATACSYKITTDKYICLHQYNHKIAYSYLLSFVIKNIKTI